MRIPWIFFRALDRLVTKERARRDAETHRVMSQRDHDLRFWANQALVAHRAGRCFLRCPFTHTE